MGRTPLHIACWQRQTKIVRYLLEIGSNIKAIDQQGNTPLHLLCLGDRQRAIKQYSRIALHMIDRGADIDVINKV